MIDESIIYLTQFRDKWNSGEYLLDMEFIDKGETNKGFRILRTAFRNVNVMVYFAGPISKHAVTINGNATSGFGSEEAAIKYARKEVVKKIGAILNEQVLTLEALRKEISKVSSLNIDDPF